MLNSKAKNILVKECFKISTHSGTDSSAEKIIDEPKMGKVWDVSQWPCWSSPSGLAVVWNGNEENGIIAICLLFLSHSSYPRLGQLKFRAANRQATATIYGHS